MIQAYSIKAELNDSSSSIQFNMSNISNSRDNKFKMQLTHIHYNIRQHIFSNRILAI